MSTKKKRADVPHYQLWSTTTLSVLDLVTKGNKAEVAEGVHTIADFLESPRPVIGPETAKWLATALHAVANGQSAGQAFGLNTKRRISLRDTQLRTDVVKTARNVSKEKARDFVANIDFERLDSTQPSAGSGPIESAGERLKKRQKRQGTK